MLLLLAVRDLAHCIGLHQLRERHALQVLVHLAGQTLPQVMGEAGLAAVAIAFAAAAGRIEGFVHCADDLRHPDLCRRTSQVIAAARATGAGHETAAAQAREQLLEIGKREILALGDLAQADRTLAVMQGQVQQRGHRVTSLGGEFHEGLELWDSERAAII